MAHVKKNVLVNTFTQTFKLTGGAITDALNRKGRVLFAKKKPILARDRLTWHKDSPHFKFVK